MFGQSLLSAFGIACTTDTDQLFTTPTSTTSLATYQLNNATTSIPSNTYPGTASNITYAAGKFGNAAVFNGSSSYIQIPNNSFNYSTMAFSAWVNPSANDTYNYIFQNGMYDNRIGGSIGWYVRREAGGSLLARGFSANSLSTAEFDVTSSGGNIIPLNTWTHVVCVLTPTSFNIYINGSSTAVASATFSNAITYSASQPAAVYIGATYYYYNASIYESWWEGKIDQVRIFNSDLSQAAITALYNETTTTATSASVDYQLANPNSIAYYKMSDATDQLGNYNGTATNVNFSTEGKFGFAGAFNGSSSKMVTGLTLPADSSMSFSLWFKTSTTGVNQSLFGEADSNFSNLSIRIGLWFDSSNVIYVWIANGSSQWYTTLAGVSYLDDNWHNFVLSIDGTSVKLYADGASTPVIDTTSSVTFGTAGVTPLTIGAPGSAYAGYFWTGAIDQVRIYDAVLSAADVSTLYKEVECKPAAINALDHFNTVLYTGNNTTNVINTVGFEPGLVWVKTRDDNKNHVLVDTVRGVSSVLEADTAAAAVTGYTDFTSFDPNGFTLAATSAVYMNPAGIDMVSWNWKAALANLSTGFNGSSTVGSASRIDLTGSTTLTTRSISLWVNLAGTGSGGNLILDNSDGQNPGVVQYGKWVIQLQYGGANYFCWDTYNGSSYGICTVNYTFNLNTWYHIVFVVEAQNQAVYINGVSQTLQGVSRPGDIGTVTMSTNRLGASWSTQYTHALNGTLGQVRIFNDALTASEVSDLYAEPAASNNTLNYPAGAGCIAAYPLQTNAVDLSGNYSGASSNVTFGQPGYLTNNTDGAIPSTVAANVEAGFSIVSYTATGSTATVGHGLGTAPDLILAKTSNQAYNWIAYSSALGSSTQLLLDSGNAAQTGSSIMASTDPTSTVFTAGAGNNLNYANGNTIIAYCFTSIPGYSKIGSYIGQTAGITIYTGFQPRFIMVKSTSNVENWAILDAVRGSGKCLNPNLSNAETDSTLNTFTTTATGFSFPHQNTADAMLNENGYKYIFLAIA
jgi:hypothetical protein